MKPKIKCRACGKNKKATNKKFPLIVRDKKTNEIQGYICRDCVKKAKKQDMKQNKLKNT